MLDEGLAILDGLWSGRPFGYQGEHYTLHEVTFLPPPVQRPRIPIWVGGWWPNKRPMRRAARWDGVTPGKLSGPMTPDDVRELVAYVIAHRASQEPFAVCVPGITPGDDPAAGAAHVAAFAEAGATWWIEDLRPGALLLLQGRRTTGVAGPGDRATYSPGPAERSRPLIA